MASPCAPSTVASDATECLRNIDRRDAGKSGCHASADDYFDGVFLAVVDELDRGAGLLLAIDDHADRLDNLRLRSASL